MRRRWISRLVPAMIVSAVLALSYVTPVPAFVGSNIAGVGVRDDHGYGYGNNCGRFGYGTHDHGKACKHPHPPGQEDQPAAAVRR
jgi:hypothetical protein